VCLAEPDLAFLAGLPAAIGSTGMTGKPDSLHAAPGNDRDVVPAPPGGALWRRLVGGQFAVTAEIGPPRGADPTPVTRKAAALRGWVDAVNITDNQGATVRLSSLAGSVAAARAGIEPIMQLTCRDRNRIALQSELLAASALGVQNVLIMTGDHPRHGDHPDAKAVFDLDSAQLLRVARTMRDEGTLMSGVELKPPPRWLLGAVENPGQPAQAAGPAGSEAPGAADAVIRRLAAKIEAGAQFVQTQFVFDVPAFAGWLRRVRDSGLDERCYILAGVGPVRSPRALAHLARIPGVHIPEQVADRLTAAGPEDFRAEGERLCSEIIAELADLDGLAGVHVMAIDAEHVIPGILERAGLPAR
jgi:methylenetetrahydrofolate reductase (NADPH)